MIADNAKYRVLSIRRVPALNAWTWIVDGFYLFKANPVMWIILLVLYLAIMIPVSLLPVLGSVMTTLFAPVFAAGMMRGCRALTHHQDLEINHLFEGFKKNTGQLITIGGIYMLGLLVIAVFLVLMLDKDVMTLIAQGKELSPEQASEVLLPILIALLFVMPVMMAYWFAPVLAGLHPLSAIDAMKLSFIACLKNMFPFLMYGFIFTILLIVMMWLIIEIHVAFAVILVALVPVMMTSLYTSYGDIFYSPDIDGQADPSGE